MTKMIEYDGRFYDFEDIEELIRLRAEQLRFYRADGTFEVLASPEEVTKRRVECAKHIMGLELVLEEISNAKVSSHPDAMSMISHMKALASRAISKNADA